MQNVLIIKNDRLKRALPLRVIGGSKTFASGDQDGRSASLCDNAWLRSCSKLILPISQFVQDQGGGVFLQQLDRARLPRLLPQRSRPVQLCCQNVRNSRSCLQFY